MPEVQILLSTYNGEAFLLEQVESIIEQTFTDWELLIRDDGSTDNTEQIIGSFIQKHPKKIRQITGGVGGNSSSSFMAMLSDVSAPYIMFCDQDDFWVNTKIEKSLEELKTLEIENAIALVYTDMEIVTTELELKHPSFLEHQRLNPEWCKNAYAVFAQSMAAGCSMIFTKALVDKLHPILAPLFQHDHWVLMHAAYYGKVACNEEALVKYRQHGMNAIGSHEIDLSYFTRKIIELKKIVKRWKYINSQFQPEVSILRLMIAKLWLNSVRFWRTM